MKDKRYLYDLKNTIHISLKLNINTDGDILSMLMAQKNRQGFIKKILREKLEDMTR